MTEVITSVGTLAQLICKIVCHLTRFVSKIPINVCCLAHYAHILAQDALAHINPFLKPHIGPQIHNKGQNNMAILATRWHVQHQHILGVKRIKIVREVRRVEMPILELF